MAGVLRGASGVISVGVHLGTGPESGGAFQYSRALLETLMCLPADEFDVMCVASHPAWVDVIAEVGFDAQLFPYDRGLRFYDRVIRQLPGTDRAWRATSPRLSPLASTIAAECNRLWIFPAQETLSYQVPVPALVTIYDLMHRYQPDMPEVAAMGRARRRDTHYRRISRWARGILVDAEVGRDHVVESYGVSPDRIHVLPPIIGRHIARVAAGDAADPPPFALPPKYFFYPAQFWTHKNHIRLLDALRVCLSDAPDMTLVLAGSPKNAYDDVRRHVRETGLTDQVVFLGFVDDRYMARLYQRARALIMPTFFGPTNIPPLEALSLGCPVACSDLYGMPAQIGDAGLTFDPRSVGAIAGALRRLWLDDQLCADFAQRGRARALSWTPGARAPRLESILRTVTG